MTIACTSDDNLVDFKINYLVSRWKNAWKNCLEN